MFGWTRGIRPLVIGAAIANCFVRMFFEVMPRGASRGEGGPHDAAVLQRFGGARIQHSFVLNPHGLRLHSRSSGRGGYHAVLIASVTESEKSRVPSLDTVGMSGGRSHVTSLKSRDRGHVISFQSCDVV